MRILLFGATGQVGSDCAEVLMRKSYDLVTISRADVDFADAKKVAEIVMQYRPDVVVNACAYTAVDKAETEPLLADQVNHLSVASLASACNTVSALLIHLSTDYVFDGSASMPYDESSSVNPLGVYGSTKWLGEQSVIKLASQYIILRTSWVFGKNGNNFVKTMLKLAGEHKELSIVSDQVGRPTYVGHIVDVIVTLVERYDRQAVIPWGIYHCSSLGEVSWHQFAQHIFDLAYRQGRLPQLPVLSAIASSSYPTSAPRPMYSVLNTNKLEALLGRRMPSWGEGLEDLLAKQ
ncbi:MAG: dTDP-4-dehydrorhamnose reductase [Candidatus Endobugula sp.]|jgi:dTDP-4-dehydrorhamnose reductase